jgi:hypothetical protein
VSSASGRLRTPVAPEEVFRCVSASHWKDKRAILSSAKTGEQICIIIEVTRTFDFAYRLFFVKNKQNLGSMFSASYQIK